MIAKMGYDPAFGARPLRRVVDEHVRAPLSEALLSKRIIKGSHVVCTVKDQSLDFTNK